MSQWKVVDTKEIPIYPTTVVVVNGIPKKHFTSVKPWKVIEEHAGEAKYDKDSEPENVRKVDRHRRDKSPRPFWKRVISIGRF